MQYVIIMLTVMMMQTGSRLRETRSVHFSDGTAPVKDTTDQTESPPSTVGSGGDVTTTALIPGDPSSVQNIPTSIRGIPELQGGNRRRLQRQGWHKSLIPEDETRLPPVILTTEVKGGKLPRQRTPTVVPPFCLCPIGGKILFLQNFFLLIQLLAWISC